MNRLHVIAVMLLVCPGALGAQKVNAASSVVVESYSVDEGLAFDRVSEVAVPVSLTFPLGRVGDLLISTGYARVTWRGTNDSLGPRSLSGLLDTEARLGINIVPGRLLVLLTGAIPTGQATLQSDHLDVVGVLSSDVIGFSAPNLGSGGYLGSGIVGAIPAGKLALGFGVTFTQPFAYEPVFNESKTLQPGGELRLRVGLEGPVAPRTYLRITTVLARRQQDEFDGRQESGVGDRIVAYVSMNQGIGSTLATFYVFDVYRTDPQLGSTSGAPAFFPAGNLLTAGTEWSLPVTRTTQLVPRAEYRWSRADLGQGTSNSTSVLQGNSLRLGIDLRQAVNRALDLVIGVGGATGRLRESDASAGFRGYRASIYLRVKP